MLRLAEHSGDDGWRKALLWAKADWLVGGPFGAAARRDGIVGSKKGKPKRPAPAQRDRWEKQRRELAGPALAGLESLPKDWEYRFSAYHLYRPLSDVEARLRAGKP